jgi:LmbE family N-acetylglucosaminyl deacetylase
MSAAAGNAARFAAKSISGVGTPTSRWLTWEQRFARLDLTSCPGLVIVAAHPDDETLGLGGMIAALTAAGVHVEVVLVSDGAAAYPSLPKGQRRYLEHIRRFELANAASILGIHKTICLGLPDGEIAEHQAWLVNQLSTILMQHPPGVWCAATWRGDGHPDHEAVGRSARSAARRTGAILLEYPIWMWHWALPDDFAVPWSRARSVPLKRPDVQRKRAATACFRSQLEPPDHHGPPILPTFVVRRLLGVGEVVFV